MKHYYFTSEAVSAGHPDKVADQISDAILDAYLELDPQAHVACETMVTTNRVIIAGEVRSTAQVDVESVARDVIKRIGYTDPNLNFSGDSVVIDNYLHLQSPDINQGVERGSKKEQGAGDQGIMFGYATNETPDYIPLTLWLANRILMKIDDARTSGLLSYLRPDAKSQVTIMFDQNDAPLWISTILISASHTDEVTQERIAEDIKRLIVEPLLAGNKLYNAKTQLLVNPTGRFVVCGPDGDTGLTGRKIICDTYGGYGAHGGGAFSGKDPSKVDRSGAYMARYIAKNLVASGACDRCIIQISYAIGVAKPISFTVNTFGTNHTTCTDPEMAHIITCILDLSAGVIESRMKLRRPIYFPTASYGHFGREAVDGLFPWEELDLVTPFKTTFGLR